MLKAERSAFKALVMQQVLLLCEGPLGLKVTPEAVTQAAEILIQSHETSASNTIVVSSEQAAQPDFFAALMKFQYGEGHDSDKGFQEMQKIAEKK